MSQPSVIIASSVVLCFLWFLLRLLIYQEIIYSVPVGIFLYFAVLLDTKPDEDLVTEEEEHPAVPPTTDEDSEEEEAAFRHRATSTVFYTRLWDEDSATSSSDDEDDDYTRHSRYLDFLNARLQLDPFEEYFPEPRRKSKRSRFVRTVRKSLLKSSCVR